MSSAPHHMFDSSPATWQELERLITQSFVEMGYEAHCGHELQTVRGKVKVDVFARDLRSPIPTTILCECKHWSKPVEQSVVYGFRAVCADVGAHLGLIVSKVGFQSGAIETREATNIHLLTFTTFQETFFEQWRNGIFDTLLRLTTPIATRVIDSLTSDDPALRKRLGGVDAFEKYEMLIAGDKSFGEVFSVAGELPVTMVDPRGAPNDLRPITIRTFREYYEIAVSGAEDARAYIDI